MWEPASEMQAFFNREMQYVITQFYSVLWFSYGFGCVWFNKHYSVSKLYLSRMRIMYLSLTKDSRQLSLLKIKADKCWSPKCSNKLPAHEKHSERASVINITAFGKFNIWELNVLHAKPTIEQLAIWFANLLIILSCAHRY